MVNAAALLSRKHITLSVIAGFVVLLAILTGCKGVPTQGERAARHEVENVARDYRPNEHKPTLPVFGTNSSLADFLKFAMLNQPKVEAAYYDWRASVERITSARSLPDPQITFQMDIQDIVTSIMPGLMMNFPGPGKLHAGAELATAESDAKYLAFQSAVLESSFELKSAYYPLYFLREKVRVNEENVSLLNDLETIARAQEAVGKVTLQDVLRAQIARDRLKTDIANLKDSRTALEARLKAALGLRADDPAPPLPVLLESTPLDLTADKLLETALTNNTRVKAIAAEVRAAEAAIHLAEKGRMPDTSLGLMADVKMNPTLYRPLATMSLPIWKDKIAAQIAEAQANKRAAQARLTQEQINLAVDLAERSFLYRQATRNLQLLREQLLPKARQSFEVARIGYLSSQLDFFNLSDTETTLLGVELDEVEAATQRELLLAEISLLAQGLPAGSSGTAGTVNMSRGSGMPAKAAGRGGM